MKRVANAFSAMVFIAVVCISVPACNFSGDTAQVTIDTGLRNQQAANVSLFDRFLALVSFSKPALADPAPMGIIYRITVSVTGTGISSMNDIEIPLDTGLIILDVPAGSGRTFTVIGWNESSQREYGGIKTVNLQGGSSVNLTIEMGELPTYPDYTFANSDPPPGVNIAWRYDTSEPLDLIGFVIYKSPVSGGPFVPLAAGRKEDFLVGSDYLYKDPDGIYDSDGDTDTYYKISAYNQFGEGMTTNEFHATC